MKNFPGVAHKLEKINFKYFVCWDTKMTEVWIWVCTFSNRQILSDLSFLCSLECKVFEVDFFAWLWDTPLTTSGIFLNIFWNL